MIVQEMARALGLSSDFVLKMARSSSHAYKTYSIPKRSGGNRVIHHPSRPLKALQRWLLREVVEKLPRHEAAMAYTRGLSVLDNATAHAGSRYLLRMDFKDFFPSIKKLDVSRYIDRNKMFFGKWGSQDVDVFCELVCRHDALTIGAPTSPALSNAICFRLDARLHELSREVNSSYTRYADDLFFSTQEPNILRTIEKQVVQVVRELEIPEGLEVNTAKTRHASKKRLRRVTGIVLGSDGKVHIGRTLKRRIRALVHKFDELDSSERSSLAGLLSYSIGMDPHFGNQLIRKYGLKRYREARAQTEGE